MIKEGLRSCSHPSWHAIKLDETREYNTHFLKEFGIDKIYGIYISDLSKGVYCCEITRSYELIFVQSVADHALLSEKKFEELGEILLDADIQSESVRYFHCSVIDRLDSQLKYKLDFDCDDEDDEEEIALETVRQNPKW